VMRVPKERFNFIRALDSSLESDSVSTGSDIPKMNSKYQVLGVPQDPPDRIFYPPPVARCFAPLTFLYRIVLSNCPGTPHFEGENCSRTQ
jgi:hypothetical protein